MEKNNPGFLAEIGETTRKGSKILFPLRKEIDVELRMHSSEETICNRLRGHRICQHQGKQCTSQGVLLVLKQVMVKKT